METVAVGGKGTIGLGTEGIIHLAWNPAIVQEADDAHVAMAMVNEIVGHRKLPQHGLPCPTRTSRSEATNWLLMSSDS